MRVVRRSVTRRLHDLHGRYSRLFWSLHSAWALVTGIVVLVLAHNRYGFLKWVVLFLGLTWISTLFFSRFAGLSDSSAFRLAKGFVSYLTRVMYQETLFFLIPFYFYSTTFPSWNNAYVVILAALAVLSCFDLLFDRLLREQPWFALSFFLVVTFSALQFFVPLLLGIRLIHGALIAAGVAFLAVIPLAYSWSDLKHPRMLLRLALALLLILGGARALRFAIPPVPLRLTRVRFSAQVDPRSLRIPAELEAKTPLGMLTNGRLYATATIFAPSRLPAALQFRFLKDGATVRWSRTVKLVAHDKGFRIWDVYKPALGRLQPGRYEVEIWTEDGQLVGRSGIVITP